MWALELIVSDGHKHQPYLWYASPQYYLYALPHYIVVLQHRWPNSKFWVFELYKSFVSNIRKHTPRIYQILMRAPLTAYSLLRMLYCVTQLYCDEADLRKLRAIVQHIFELCLFLLLWNWMHIRFLLWTFNIISVVVLYVGHLESGRVFYLWLVRIWQIHPNDSAMFQHFFWILLNLIRRIIRSILLIPSGSN